MKRFREAESLFYNVVSSFEKGSVLCPQFFHDLDCFIKLLDSDDRFRIGVPIGTVFHFLPSGTDAKIEATMLDLKEKYTFILVTNNTKQAARVADRTAFFYAGELIEIDMTEKIFTNPSCAKTDEYIRGKFG